MAVIRRYFDSTGAGLADGTSWANRAPFLSSGVVSTIIRGFDFTSDSLEAYVGSGTYTITTSLSSFTGPTGPSTNNPCIIIGCDNNGDKLQSPEPNWCSPKPWFDDSNFPLINNSTNQILNSSSVAFECFRIVGSHNGVLISTHYYLRWCYVENTNSGSSAVAVTGNGAMDENCTFVCSGTNYLAVYQVSSTTPKNCRIIGNLLASSGSRYGWQSGSNGLWYFEKCTFINSPEIPVYYSGTSSGISMFMNNCTIYNSTQCTGAGISCAGTRTSTGLISGNLIVNCGTYAIDVTGTTRHVLQNNAYRDCPSGFINGAGNLQTNETLITETDNELFVDASNLDLRIKKSSTYWGKGFGAGDQELYTTNGKHPLI